MAEGDCRKMKCCIRCVPPKRHPGCHAVCPEYKEERAEYDRLKAAYNEKQSAIHSVTSQKYDGVRRAYKRHGRNKRKL
jgi:hypothetical protein